MLTKLRAEMARSGIDIYIVENSDCHLSEYPAEHFRFLSRLCGFTGSAGTLLISQKRSCLITDSRYFIQAQNEITRYKTELLKDIGNREELLKEFIMSESGYCSSIAADYNTLTYDAGCLLDRIANNYEALFINIDFSYIWNDRPTQNFGDIRCAGTSVSDAWYFENSPAEKIKKIRETLKESGADFIPIICLDDIMYLFNLRGSDDKYSPVAYSYAFLSSDAAILFAAFEHFSADSFDRLKKHCKDNSIELKNYTSFHTYLKEYRLAFPNAFSYISNDSLNFGIAKILCPPGICKGNPMTSLKAVKSAGEILHIKNAFLQDSLVLTRFIMWLKNRVSENLCESEVARKLDEMRLACPDCVGPAFETICAYKENAAIVHYCAKPGEDKTLEPGGMLLVDSGGQYLGVTGFGTTDTTRTIVFGSISSEEKEAYTAVLRGLFALQYARFAKGASDRTVDAIARAPIWKAGHDYGHGTGHGIGYGLNVHEGGIRLSYKKRREGMENELRAGMVFSIEPGIYVEGKYGIRLENSVYIKGEDPMEIEPLTLVPFDKEALTQEALSDPGFVSDWNRYHGLVMSGLEPFLTKEERSILEKLIQ